jgi:hypothetical protein
MTFCYQCNLQLEFCEEKEHPVDIKVYIFFVTLMVRLLYLAHSTSRSKCVGTKMGTMGHEVVHGTTSKK